MKCVCGHDRSFHAPRLTDGKLGCYWHDCWGYWCGCKKFRTAKSAKKVRKKK